MQDTASMVDRGENSQKPSRSCVRCRGASRYKLSGIEEMTSSLKDRPTSEGAERWRIAGLRVWMRKGVCEINVKQLGKSQREVTIFGSARCQDAKR